MGFWIIFSYTIHTVSMLYPYFIHIECIILDLDFPETLEVSAIHYKAILLFRSKTDFKDYLIIAFLSKTILYLFTFAKLKSCTMIQIHGIKNKLHK